MRRILFCITILMLTLGTVSAQQPNGQNGKERIEQQTRTYITAFSLNEEQAQRFGTLYKAYNKQMRAIHDQYRHERTAERSTLTDEQIEQRILDNFAQSRAILDAREQYYKEFRKILTPTQINRIFEDEKARRAQMRR